LNIGRNDVFSAELFVIIQAVKFAMHEQWPNRLIEQWSYLRDI